MGLGRSTRTSEAVEEITCPVVVGNLGRGTVLGLELRNLVCLGDTALELDDVGGRFDLAGDALDLLQLDGGGCAKDGSSEEGERGGDDGEELHGGEHGA